MKVKTKGILIFGSISMFILFGYLRGYVVDEELRKNGEVTIGKIDSIERLPKWSIIYVSYYKSDKRKSFSEDNLGTEISNRDIGKFYEVKYLPDSPRIIRGIYSKQITDTTAILKAGFSREEIETGNFTIDEPKN